MKRVLFITFFWPPSGKATLHWPLKIIKYLPASGWQPVVLTVNEDTFTAKDESLLKDVDENLEVIKTGYFDPFYYYRKLLGKDPEAPLNASETISRTNKSLRHRLSIWIRMNLFVPDARIGWYRKGVNKGKEYLSANPVDAIVTIGPPHSSHLIGRKLSSIFKLPHIPVLIDPWTDIVYYRGFNRNKFILKLDNHFEKMVLERSAANVFVTKSTREDYIEKYPSIAKKSHVLYWGYNEDDFQNIESKEKGAAEILLHAGNIFDYQNTVPFWQTVKKEIEKGRKLKIKFIGTVSPAIKNTLDELGLTSSTEYSGFLPYKKMLEEICSADYLLVCATEKRHVPGKLFEYLRSGKPIIAFGDDNDEVKEIIERANAGKLFSYSDPAEEFFEIAKNFKTNLSEVARYDRKYLAEKFGSILSKLDMKRR